MSVGKQKPRTAFTDIVQARHALIKHPVRAGIGHLCVGQKRDTVDKAIFGGVQQQRLVELKMDASIALAVKGDGRIAIDSGGDQLPMAVPWVQTPACAAPALHTNRATAITRRRGGSRLLRAWSFPRETSALSVAKGRNSPPMTPAPNTAPPSGHRATGHPSRAALARLWPYR